MGAKGVETVVAGKIRGARAKAMKFTDGYMIKSGEPKRQYVDTAVRHVALRQGMLGVRVTIMLPFDPTGKTGPKTPLPDQALKWTLLTRELLPKFDEAHVCAA